MLFFVIVENYEYILRLLRQSLFISNEPSRKISRKKIDFFALAFTMIFADAEQST